VRTWLAPIAEIDVLADAWRLAGLGIALTATLAWWGVLVLVAVRFFSA